MEFLKQNLLGMARYRGREGQFSFILHRLTGLGTLLFLAVHILDTSTVYFISSLYEHAIRLYRSTFFMLGEIILAFFVIYHGVNGVRITIFDLFVPDGWNVGTQRKSAIWSLVIAILIWIPAAIIMGHSLLDNNFGFSD